MLLVHSFLSLLVSAQLVHPEIWPKVPSPVSRDAAIEQAVDKLLAGMSVEEKVAQVIQPSIAYVTPEDVRKYHFGSVLNGGGGWPGDIRKVTVAGWLAKADAFYAASMDTSGGKQAIPIIWGADAVHGHNNLVGATLFPHNIGLGATRDADLVRRTGEITAAEMAVTGIDWNFFPNVAAVQDVRWGRSYETYSEDPAVVRKMAAAYVEGVQGKAGTPAFLDRRHVLACAKHFLGDGGTAGGKDQGDNVSNETEMRDVHAAGYAGALGAGVQTVMASFSSWHGQKMHGNRELMTGVLKERMGFDGFVVGDWNGHGQVPGCTNGDCPQSFNAGVDMFMVPQDWKSLYENTLAEVKSGVIPQARLDDAVRRILRVKMRAGLFTAGKPSQRLLAGNTAAVGSAAHREVARQAVRESLVLLKNNGNVLPLAAKRTVLVAGDGADNIPKQAGGWTLSWQGDGNTNANFPGATSIWSGVKRAVESAGGHATLSADGSFTEKPDAAIVVYGENPYAEMVGDLRTLAYSDAPSLAILQKLKTAGVPVVSVFLSGRPLSVNRFLNASDAFVAAWLPGTEGEGIADVLFGTSDFQGKLPFAWPNAFPFGYGLVFSQVSEVRDLPVESDGTNKAAHSFRIDTSGGFVIITPDQDLARETNAGLAVSFDYVARQTSARATHTASLRCLGNPPFRFAIDATTVENVKLVPAAEGPCQ